MSATLSGIATSFKGASAGAVSDGGLSPERLDLTPSASVHEQASLGFALRLRHALLALAIGVLALAACVSLALLIVAGPFHTALGALA